MTQIIQEKKRYAKPEVFCIQVYSDVVLTSASMQGSVSQFKNGGSLDDASEFETEYDPFEDVVIRSVRDRGLKY